MDREKAATRVFTSHKREQAGTSNIWNRLKEQTYHQSPDSKTGGALHYYLAGQVWAKGDMKRLDIKYGVSFEKPYNNDKE